VRSTIFTYNPNNCWEPPGTVVGHLTRNAYLIPAPFFQLMKKSSRKINALPTVPRPVIDGARVEAEIATLELLNQRDTMLCDDLRAACRTGENALPKAGGGGAGGGRNHSKISCWSLIQGIGFPKKAPVPGPLAVTSPALLGIRSTGGGSGSGSGSGAGPALLGNHGGSGDDDFGGGRDGVGKDAGNNGDGGGKPAAPSEGERSGSAGGGGSADEDESDDDCEDTNKRPFSK